MSPFSISSCSEAVTTSEACITDVRPLHRRIHSFGADTLNSMNEFVLLHPEDTSPPVFLLISHRTLWNVRHLKDRLTPWKRRFLSSNPVLQNSHEFLTHSAFFSIFLEWSVPSSFLSDGEGTEAYLDVFWPVVAVLWKHLIDGQYLYS